MSAPETTQPSGPSFPGIELSVPHIRAAVVKLAEQAERERAFLVARLGALPAEMADTKIGTNIGRCILSPIEFGCYELAQHLCGHLANLIGSEAATKLCNEAAAEGKRNATRYFEDDKARCLGSPPAEPVKPEPKPRTRRATPPASTARH